MKWYKNPMVSILWAVIRIWLGIQWIQAGLHKVVDGFDASGFMKGAIAGASGENPTVQGWYASFIESVALPNAKLFSVLVAYGELLVGIGLIVGALTIPALIAGAFMNLNFLLAGTVSTNPTLYTVAIILLFVGSASYYWGIDRFLLPFLKAKTTNKGPIGKVVS